MRWTRKSRAWLACIWVLVIIWALPAHGGVAFVAALVSCALILSLGEEDHR